MMGSSSPPASGTDAMKTLGDLLGVVSDPAAYNERLSGLKEAEASARAANEELKATGAEVAAARAALASEKAQLDADQSKFAQYQTSQTTGIEQRLSAINRAADTLAANQRKLETDTIAATNRLDDTRKELDVKAAKLTADIEAHRKSTAESEKAIKSARATADLLDGHSNTLRQQHDAANAAEAAAQRAHADVRTTIDKILAASK